MEKETISLERPVRSERLNITVIAKLRIDSWKHASLGIKQPIAVLIASAAGKQIFSLKSGETITLEQLVAEHPTVKSELDKLQS